LRVSGSLSIPAYQIKAKRFLRGKKLLLLGEGHSYGELEHLVQALRGAGHEEVAIVEGGLAAWHQEVGLVDGVVPAGRLATVSPQDYSRERQYEHWKVAFIQRGDLPDGLRLLSSDPAVISIDAEPAEIRSRLGELAAAGEGGLRGLVLIASRDGERYARVRAIMKGSGLWNLFFLEGGLQAYARYLDRSHAMQSRHGAKAKMRPTSCGAQR
jgi:hypothetical protein